MNFSVSDTGIFGKENLSSPEGEFKCSTTEIQETHRN